MISLLKADYPGSEAAQHCFVICYGTYFVQRFPLMVHLSLEHNHKWHGYHNGVYNARTDRGQIKSAPTQSLKLIGATISTDSSI